MTGCAASPTGCESWWVCDTSGDFACQGCVFQRCLADLPVASAGQAAYSSTIWVTPPVNMLLGLRIPLQRVVDASGAPPHARARRHTSNSTCPGRVQGRGVGKLAQKWCGPASIKAKPLGNRRKLARLRTKQGSCIGHQQCPPPLHVHVMVVFQRLVTSWLMPGCAASPTGSES